MVRPNFRTNTQRKVKKKLPGNTVTTQYVERKPEPARCGGCGRKLSGVPRLRPIAHSKLSKTQRRPERPYGGVLCSNCMRELIKFQARGEE